MPSLLNRLLQHILPPMDGSNPASRMLQRIRRRSFRIRPSDTTGYFAQDGQDKFLDEVIFRGKRGGTFVDIGANDGVALSNTYFFETHRGWSGVCVEPQPDKFAQLSGARKCRCVNACVADKSGTAKFLHVRGPSEMLSGLVSKYDPRHRQRVERELAELGGNASEIDVPCFTFRELAAQHGIGRVDYLSIDTEGGELDLLKSIDFRATPVDVVSVENCFSDGRHECFMRSHGYRLAAVLGADDIYVSESFAQPSAAT